MFCGLGDERPQHVAMPAAVIIDSHVSLQILVRSLRYRFDIAFKTLMSSRYAAYTKCNPIAEIGLEESLLRSFSCRLMILIDSLESKNCIAKLPTQEEKQYHIWPYQEILSFIPFFSV